MSDPWVKFYASDWLAGTRGLSLQEAGLYITLIAMMYERSGPIDMDQARLCRLCGATPAAFKKALQGLLDAGLLTRSERGIWNNRVAKEIQKRAKKAESARESANERWEKAEQKQSPSDANASETQCERDATRSQIPDTRSIKEPKGSKKAGRKIVYSDEFEAWWKAYPVEKSGSKMGAFDCWQAMDADDRELATLALPVYRDQLAEPDAQWGVHATTFFNQRRYETMQPPETDWAKFVSGCREFGFWTDTLGPKPGELGCKAPAEIQREYGFEPQIGSAA